MKRLQTSLALIALFALMVPCVHANEHRHHDMTGAELCAVDHVECHACSDKPCIKPEPVVSSSAVASVAVPVRHSAMLLIFTTYHFIPGNSPAPSGSLRCLQTVQLLI